MAFRKRKTDSADLRRYYTLIVQSGLIASLVLLIVLFSVEWRGTGEFDIIFEEQEVIEIEEIEQTQQIEEPPPPPQPPPPIEVPDDEIDEMIDLDLDMDLDLDRAPPAPPPPPGPPAPEPDPEPEIFVVVEQMPEPVGGIEGIQRRVRYPELARRAGIEGTVFVQFVVDEQGRVSELACTRDPGGGTCQASIDAIRATEFIPGRQRGQPVKVRFSIPVRFRLN